MVEPALPKKVIDLNAAFRSRERIWRGHFQMTNKISIDNFIFRSLLSRCIQIRAGSRASVFLTRGAKTIAAPLCQRFVASYAYNLPVGRNQRFAGNTNRVADAAVGGWELTGIGTFQSGFPFSVLATDEDGLLGSPVQRANINGNPHTGFTKSTSEWFNTSVFSQPPAGVFGNSGRNLLNEPGISNWDMGLVKYIPITERAKFQLRIETFNTFNHTQWGVDPATQGGSGPGTSAEVTNVNAGNFGAITSARLPRVIQFGGKVTF
jgi:hypothetical protein